MARKSEKNDIWERQPNESSQAYEAFAAYRDMGAERSIRAVTQKLHKSLTIIGRWSRNWNWVERARAWDNELARCAKAEAAKKAADMTNRHINLAMQIQKRAVEELRDVDMASPAAMNILRYIEKGAALERLNRLEQAGMEPTGRGRSRDDPGGTRSLADLITGAYARRKESGDDD